MRPLGAAVVRHELRIRELRRALLLSRRAAFDVAEGRHHREAEGF